MIVGHKHPRGCTLTSCNDNIGLHSLAVRQHNTAHTCILFLKVLDNALSPLNRNAASLDLAKQHVEELDTSLHEPAARSLAANQTLWIVELWPIRTLGETSQL
jgi:hypothetical protein